MLAACAGVANARFEVAGAQVHQFQAGAFDVVLSSLGVMFFDDPAAAFANATEILAGLSQAQAAELTGQVRDRLVTYAPPDGVIMPGAGWLVTAHAV
jgi:hypothetical protein